MFTQKTALFIGWTLFSLVLILLVSNILNDMRLYGQPSFLSKALTIGTLGGILITKLRGKPLVTAEGWQGRLLITIVGLISFLLLAVAVVLKTG